MRKFQVSLIKENFTEPILEIEAEEVSGYGCTAGDMIFYALEDVPITSKRKTFFGRTIPATTHIKSRRVVGHLHCPHVPFVVTEVSNV